MWCADVTYIPMQRGFLYLVAIMDWATRTVLWRLSNTQDTAYRRLGYGREVYSSAGLDFRTMRSTTSRMDGNLASWLRYEERPHSSLAGDRTPMEAYTGRRAA